MSIAVQHAPTQAHLVVRPGEALYWSFVVCLVVVSLPIKNLAYLAPLVYLAIQYWYGNHRLLMRTASLVAIVTIVSLLSVAWDSLRAQTVNLPGIAMGALTYLPLMVVLCERFNRTIDETLFRRFVNVCCWFVIVQSTVGLLQFAAFGNTDTVCGTYGLLDGMHSTITIAQVHFTFTIFGMLLFILPEIRRPLVATAFVVALPACAVAQSGHQTIFLVGALVACAVLGVLRLKVLVTAAATAAALCGLVAFFYPQTYELAVDWYSKTVEHPDSPKRIVVAGATDILQDEKNALLGVGVGQYSSRAALITSNSYLNVELPGLITGRSDYFTRYVEEGQAKFRASGEGSAIAKPYFSMVSLVAELGWLQFLALSTVFVLAVWRNSRLLRCSDKAVALTGYTAVVGIVFFLLCCLVENYAEFAQAITLPLLLYVVGHSRVRTRLSDAEVRPSD